MILITGASGQLGLALQEAASLRGIPFAAMDRDALDIAIPEEIARACDPRLFDCIINCAAQTAVDAAEDHPGEAFAANTFGPWRLALSGIPLIHVSTDYVFDGLAKVPYAEDAPAHPVSVYGLSKRAGEAALLEGGFRGVVVRTAWVYSLRDGTKNFCRTIRRLSHEREKLTVVADQRGAPTLAEDLAEALLALFVLGEHKKPMHILHFTSAGSTTWHGFAERIVQLDGARCRVMPVSTAEYPVKARRPAYSVLSLERIRALGIEPRPWEEALEDAFQRLKNHS